MATNNYFGFTHGGTQYGTTGAAAAYQTTQTGYAVGHTAATPGTPYTPQRAAAGYDASAYQATAATHTTAGTYAGAASTPAGTTYDYGYPRSAAAAAAAAATYDGSKTYYQQPSPAAAAAAAAAATYSAAESPYQGGATVASKPAYSTTSTYSAASRPVTQTTQKQAASSYSSGYAAAPTTSNYTSGYGAAAQQTTASTKAPTYTGYDAALYSAATMYVQQQAQSTPTNPSQVKPSSGTWQTYKKGGGGGAGGGGGGGSGGGIPPKAMKPKQPPKPQQLHYCDVCKISCAGPQTYREHLEGQKHKKKEAALKTGTTTVPRGGSALRCELCDVTCTGSDAYAAHIRGAKHQKVVKLHTKLGKPIPSTEPQIIAGNTKTTTTTADVKRPGFAFQGGGNGFSPMSSAVGVGAVGVGGSVGAGGGSLEDKTSDGANKEDGGTKEELLKLEEKEIQPVGQDYIEEIKNEEGKVISFNCKLCECRFNDPNAKEMHMKGRRHRLQYKKKVNPDLVVDLKPSLRQRRIQEEKLRRQQMREEFWRRREEERMMEEEERLYWEERRRYEEEMEYYEWYRRYGCSPRAMPPPPRPFGPGMTPPMYFPQPLRRPDSSDDRHVVAKHAEIYPKEEELQAIQKIVSNTEKALKLVSDFIAEVDGPKGGTATVAKAVKPEAAPVKKDGVVPPVKDEGEKKEEGKEKEGKEGEKKEEPQPPRMLKGVMRVGVLAKGLLLHGDLNVHLVVLCAEKPTRRLLDRVSENLPKQLSSVAAEEKYDLKKCPAEAAVTVTAQKEPHISVTITLTSPVMREQLLLQEGGDAQSQAQVKDPPDVLDRQKCLDALAALRHAKWFQARAAGLQSCVMVIRILRDLCQRVPTWGPLNNWAAFQAMELLAEKVISSGGQPLTPGDALRRVFEALAAGILLPGGPGLLDPCEKDPTDAAAVLSNQEREDITASAQHALRLIAFRQIHKVLGMDPLPPPKFTRGRFNRKRRRDNSSGEGNDSEGEDEEHWPQRKHLSMSGGDGKKDKKEDGGGEGEKMETEKSEVGLPAK